MKTATTMLVCIGLIQATNACTTAVISGAATRDGRPLLWKNRDTTNEKNEVRFCTDGKYRYIGLTNAGDDAGTEIWAGVNETGFAIMNSDSPNMGEPGQRQDGDGRWMKLALQSCESVDDFEALLRRNAAIGRDVETNFGVIDRFGGAAYFETGAHACTRFDANAAPLGLLIRTNYSTTGKKDGGSGYIRHDRATVLVDAAAREGALDCSHIFSAISRDLVNEKIASHPEQAPVRGTQFIHTVDTINRSTGVAGFVVHGVKAGEDPALTTMWCLLGQPVTGVALPLWVHAGSVPTEMNGETEAPLNRVTLALKGVLYPDRRGNHRHYLDLYPLLRDGGLLPSLLAYESEVFARTDAKLAQWREALPTPGEMRTFESELAADCLRFLESKMSELSKDIKPPGSAETPHSPSP